MNKVSPLGKLRSLAAQSPAQRLPSVRRLAAQWGISTRTVQEAVRDGVAEGWLETRRGAGIWPMGAAPVPRSVPLRLDAGRLAEKLTESIRLGQVASDQLLPSPKDQAQSLGLHPATVRKAYHRVQVDGLVQRLGRSWKVCAPTISHSYKPLVLCLGAAGPDGHLRMESDREWEFWREIQLEALRCGLEPRLVAIPEGTPELDPDAFGAVVSNWHMPETEPLLDELRRLRIPSAIWVATEESLPGARYREARGLWFHDLANGRGAGETMAEHILALAHRKVAWISPFHGSAWSRNRLEGLKQRLGQNVEVVEAVHDWISEWDMQVTVAGDPEVTGRFDLSGIDPQVNPEHLRRPVVEALTRQRCVHLFAPRLEDALRSGATIWVAASDLVAQWCLPWLQERGVRIPRDLALASFDDTREATRQNLTSLRFDVQSMARAMVRQILSSRQDHKRVTRYAGQVMERGSTMSDRRFAPPVREPIR